MFDVGNNLLDFTGMEQNRNLAPNEKILYKVFAPVEDNENLDHYVVSAVDGILHLIIFLLINLIQTTQPQMKNFMMNV